MRPFNGNRKRADKRARVYSIDRDGFDEISGKNFVSGETNIAAVLLYVLRWAYADRNTNDNSETRWI